VPTARTIISIISSGFRSTGVGIDEAVIKRYLALGSGPKKTLLTIVHCGFLRPSRGVRRFVLWAFC
jgi:hypothetical protein